MNIKKTTNRSHRLEISEKNLQKTNKYLDGNQTDAAALKIVFQPTLSNSYVEDNVFNNFDDLSKYVTYNNYIVILTKSLEVIKLKKTLRTIPATHNL